MSEPLVRSRSGLIIRSTRIVTGLVLLVFVTSHLLNASFGLISIDAMDKARPVLSGIWGRTLPFALLSIALIVHFFLGLWAIFKRPTLRTNTQDMVQLLSSVCIVPLLATHAVGVYFIDHANIDVTYALIIQAMWVDLPYTGLIQVLLLALVWIHGCAGLITWLRAHERARNVLPYIYPLAVAIPIAALLGFSEAGRRALAENAAQSSKSSGYESSYGTTTSGYGSESDRDGQATARYGQSATADTAGGYGDTVRSDDGAGPQNPVQAIDMALLRQVTSQMIWTSIALAALTFLARWVRRLLVPLQRVQVVRNAEAMAPNPSNLSLLDVFRHNDTAHASLCEGRGRCGTCAIRVVSSEFPVPEATELELKALRARNLPPDARLACQLVPAGGAIEVEALYPADYSYDDDHGDGALEPSVAERQV